LKPEDLYLLQSLTDPQISSDGRFAAVISIQVDAAADGYLSALWLIDLATSGRVVVDETAGLMRSPRFSDDSRYLAWIAPGRVAYTEVERVIGKARDRGEWNGLGEETGDTEDTARARTLMVANKFAKNLEWAPGEPALWLAVVHRDQPNVSIHTGWPHKADGRGMLQASKSDLLKVSLDGSAFVQYTHPREIMEVCVAPDTHEVTFTDYGPFSQDLYVFHPQQGQCRRLTNGEGPIAAIRWVTPSGGHVCRGATHPKRWIVWSGHRGPRWNDSTTSLWGTDPDSGVSWPVADTLDYPAAPYGLGDVCPVAADPQIVPSRDGALWFLASEHGVSGVYVLDDPGCPTTLPRRVASETVRCVSRFALGPAGELLFVGRDPARPDALYLRRDQKETVVFAPNAEVTPRLELREPVRLDFTAADGRSLEGWLLTPGPLEAGPYPLILVIHGGPHNAYGYGLQAEFQTLCTAGYAVLYMNPRGSQTYGQAFASAVVEDWGGKDFEDLMGAVDELVARGIADPERLGVTGYSYGGHMTNWIVAHTRRFRAAAAGGCVSNLVSFQGASDIGARFGYEEHGVRPWENVDALWERSPLAHVERIQTPLLLYHAKGDERCPIGQSEEMFSALSSLGQEVVFVTYPEDSHAFLSQGRPSHRVHRLRLVAEWFASHIPSAHVHG
jgi:dipeptidyl aminopeptidase/acylaminoacyl peptidase